MGLHQLAAIRRRLPRKATVTDFKKYLLAAECVLKGRPFQISADELETAMFALSEAQREEGESSAEAFARLSRDSDGDVAKLYAAMDVRRVAERHAQVLARRSTSIVDASSISKAASEYAAADRRLDDFVKANTKPGETHAAATARLASEDRRFGELYALLDQKRRLALG